MWLVALVMGCTGMAPDEPDAGLLDAGEADPSMRDVPATPDAPLAACATLTLAHEQTVDVSTPLLREPWPFALPGGELGVVFTSYAGHPALARTYRRYDASLEPIGEDAVVVTGETPPIVVPAASGDVLLVATSTSLDAGSSLLRTGTLDGTFERTTAVDASSPHRGLVPTAAGVLWLMDGADDTLAILAYDADGERLSGPTALEVPWGRIARSPAGGIIVAHRSGALPPIGMPLPDVGRLTHVDDRGAFVSDREIGAPSSITELWPVTTAGGVVLVRVDSDVLTIERIDATTLEADDVATYPGPDGQVLAATLAGRLLVGDHTVDGLSLTLIEPTLARGAVLAVALPDFRESLHVVSLDDGVVLFAPLEGERWWLARVECGP